MDNYVSRETLKYVEKRLIQWYYYFGATNTLEPSQNRKVAALIINVCVHLFLGVKMETKLDKLIKLAQKVAKKGEIPVSCMIVDKNNKILSVAVNNRQKKKNVYSNHKHFSSL